MPTVAKTISAFFLVAFVLSASTIAKPPSHLLGNKPSSTSCAVLIFGDLRGSETTFIFQVLLQQTGKCGCHLVWRKRAEFISLRDGIQQYVHAVILIGTFGPSEAEQLVLQTAPGSEIITVLHFSDEMLLSRSSSIYGKARQSFRNYYHRDMDQYSMDYLLESSAPPNRLPKVLWMPLGMATLMPLPSSFTYSFLDRPLLWSWAGSIDNKPERSEMLTALKEDKDADYIAKRGKVHSFGVFAGIGQSLSPDSWNSWEYSIMMQQTQFVPVPAGISAEQYRIWEGIEAGAAFQTSLCHTALTLASNTHVTPSFLVRYQTCGFSGFKHLL